MGFSTDSLAGYYMTKTFIFALIMVGLICVACTRTQEELSEQDRALGVAIGFPDALLLQIKNAGKNMRQLQGIDSGGIPFLASGVTIDVRQENALTTVRRLQDVVGPGYYVFISERNFGIGGAPDNVSFLKTSDPYDMLRTMGTNGWNYDISPEMVIARLKEWDRKFGIAIHGVGFDWVEGEFKSQPSDMPGFANEVYKFCPDVVDQGTETVAALAAHMAEAL